MNPCDLLIIGSGPAAYSCAITARKRDLNVTVAGASSTDTWLWRADCIANYPGLPNISGRDLLEKFHQQTLDAGADFVHGVARQVQPLGEGFMTLIGNDIIESKAVALCMGAARPKLLPGEDALLGQGVSWCGTCDGMFYRGKEVAVLSAWKDGIEEADFLAKLASKVDYYRLAAHDLPENPPFAVMDGKPLSLEKKDGKIALTTNQGEKSYDGVFVFRPSVAPDRLLPGIQLDGAFLHVDRRMATSIPRVYAAGDCTGLPLQIAKAVGEGNVAAISAAEDLARMKKEGSR